MLGLKRSLSVLGMVVVLGATHASAATVFGLTTRDQLIRFDSSNPVNLQQASFITGLASNEQLLGIDYRPANNVLYGLGSFGNLYTINTMSAAASFVASLTNASGGGPISLSGSEFGVDFNPAADRLRVTSDLGMNLRINVATGSTIVDGTLNQTSGAPNIVASAYTNNDNNTATGTTLYNIDSVSNMLTIQNPPNNGTQMNVGMLGFDVTALAGFDILTTGPNVNTGFVALQPVGSVGSSFGTINLSTGVVSLMGAIGTAQTSDSIAVRDIAVTPVPEPATIALLGLGSALIARRRKKA